jgi:hypothetical protein
MLVESGSSPQWARPGKGREATVDGTEILATVWPGEALSSLAHASE